MMALSMCHTYTFSVKWIQQGKEQGLQKSQRIILFPFGISLLLNHIREGMGEVMQSWEMVASISGQLYMRSVFLRRDFNTPGWKGDLGLNRRAAYLKVHDGRRKGSAEVLHTLGPVRHPPPGPYLKAAARGPPACSPGCPSTPAPGFFLCGTCRSLAHTRQSEFSKLAPSRTLWPERDNETLLRAILCPYIRDGQEMLAARSEYLPWWMDRTQKDKELRFSALLP